VPRRPGPPSQEVLGAPRGRVDSRPCRCTPREPEPSRANGPRRAGGKIDVHEQRAEPLRGPGERDARSHLRSGLEIRVARRRPRRARGAISRAERPPAGSGYRAAYRRRPCLDSHRDFNPDTTRSARRGRNFDAPECNATYTQSAGRPIEREDAFARACGSRMGRLRVSAWLVCALLRLGCARPRRLRLRGALSSVGPVAPREPRAGRRSDSSTSGSHFSIHCHLATPPGKRTIAR